MTLVVDPVELHRASQKFNQLASEYVTVYKRLMNTASTMGKAWEAADNLAFVEQITGFCEELKLMADHLEGASKALERQAANYEQTPGEIITRIKQMTN